MLGISATAQAALVGRLPTTPGGTDYQAYYDPNANLTWLANANAAAGSSYDTFNPGTGVMNWNQANEWAASLNINGIAGWRLPDMVLPDPTCSSENGSVPPVFLDHCSGSELGNLFFNVLGGPPNSKSPLTGTGPFSNVQPSFYWTESRSGYAVGTAWYFLFIGGVSGYSSEDASYMYAWAVHSGDVAPVPLPSALWLMVTALMSLGGFTVLRAKGSDASVAL